MEVLMMRSVKGLPGVTLISGTTLPFTSNVVPSTPFIFIISELPFSTSKT